MKTRLTLLFISLFAASSALLAQATEECVTTMSIFSEHAKVKNYEAAYEPFMKLRKDCPNVSYALYQYGERLLRDKLDNAPEGEKMAVAQDFIKLHEEKFANFPDKTGNGEHLTDIALLMYENNIGSKMEQFKKFDEAYKADKESFKNARALYIYFVLAVELQEAGEMDLNDIFVLYDEVQEKITIEQNASAESIAPILEKEDAGTALDEKEARAKSAAQTNLENYANITAGINEKLGKLADCDNLIPLYQKDFETKKSDIDWIRRAAGRMSAKECTGDPFFEKLVVQLDKLEPSAETAYYLGQLADKNGNKSKAFEYYEKSASRQTDPNKRARVYTTLGDQMLNKKSYSQARAFYRKSLEAKASNGLAYLRIAQMYASSANNCGNNVFEKRAVYWLAAEYASRAGRIDPSLSTTANKTAASYRALAPSKTDIFNNAEYNIGTRISFGCWIGESVTVPSL